MKPCRGAGRPALDVDAAGAAGLEHARRLQDVRPDMRQRPQTAAQSLDSLADVLAHVLCVIVDQKPSGTHRIGDVILCPRNDPLRGGGVDTYSLDPLSRLDRCRRVSGLAFDLSKDQDVLRDKALDQTRKVGGVWYVLDKRLAAREVFFWRIFDQLAGVRVARETLGDRVFGTDSRDRGDRRGHKSLSRWVEALVGCSLLA